MGDKTRTRSAIVNALGAARLLRRLSSPGLAPLWALVALAAMGGANRLGAQAPPPDQKQSPARTESSAAAPQRPSPNSQATSSQAKPSPATPAPDAASAPAAPVTPPPPNWPINDKPVAATVVWDSRGLMIQADNSSLDQILEDVSTDTGATVEGLNGDQRVFGTYGPGPARQVLSDLLDGTGYNVLMFGEQGAGTPREIVLSAPPTGPAPVNNNRSLASEEEYEPEPAPEPEPQVLPQYQAQPQQPAMPPRTPQQILQEMQQRQQQMQQQQQQQNENQPPNNQQ
jgi:hypothetical protein